MAEPVDFLRGFQKKKARFPAKGPKDLRLQAVGEPGSRTLHLSHVVNMLSERSADELDPHSSMLWQVTLANKTLCALAIALLRGPKDARLLRTRHGSPFEVVLGIRRKTLVSAQERERPRTFAGGKDATGMTKAHDFIHSAASEQERLLPWVRTSKIWWLVEDAVLQAQSGAKYRQEKTALRSSLAACPFLELAGNPKERNINRCTPAHLVCRTQISTGKFGRGSSGA